METLKVYMAHNRPTYSIAAIVIALRVTIVAIVIIVSHEVD